MQRLQTIFLITYCMTDSPGFISYTNIDTKIPTKITQITSTFRTSRMNITNVHAKRINSLASTALFFVKSALNNSIAMMGRQFFVAKPDGSWSQAGSFWVYILWMRYTTRKALTKKMNPVRIVMSNDECSYRPSFNCFSVCL